MLVRCSIAGRVSAYRPRLIAVDHDNIQVVGMMPLRRGVVVDVTLPRPLDGASARCGQAKVARCLCQNDGLFLIDLELIH